jgi:selenocysteine lyase/cysteine desulfurase
MYTVDTLETYFSAFRANIIGQQVYFNTPFGRKRLLYADWTASGRAYGPIEARLQEILPYYANTHTEATVTGTLMSAAYERAREVIKEHVGAREDDALIFCGSGMTSAVNKLQRILGLRVPERVSEYMEISEPEEESRPLVLVTHMEHHSNHISWLETLATVEMIPPGEDGGVDVENFRKVLARYGARRIKIAAVTACSNVTGIETPYREIARVMHECGGWCFVDFACSAPYVKMEMRELDAIYFSMHKFLGGPGTPGVLVFNRKLYANRVPDQPGGGTLLYSTPWKEFAYLNWIEHREDGGTPPILQGIKAALCIRLKEEMGVDRMLRREAEIVGRLLDRLSVIEGLEILAADRRKRLGVISFIVKDAHYQVVVRLLNDRFGIQTRGGCSCAGSYGHFLLGIDRERSRRIIGLLEAGEMWSKPGWVRVSLHPTMSDTEVEQLADAIRLTVENYAEWSKGYAFDHSGHDVCGEIAESWLGRLGGA